MYESIPRSFLYITVDSWKGFLWKPYLKVGFVKRALDLPITIRVLTINNQLSHGK